ncbi:MAG: ZIP family metal transporter [Anaerolineales bacterium]
MSVFIAVLLASFMACAVTTAGILVIGRHRDWANRNAAYFMSFAAGVLIAVSFIHIIPKCFTMNPEAPTYLLAGFLLLYVFNRFLKGYVCQHRCHQELALGLTPLVGIGFHSLLDGVIHSVTFNVSIFTGITAAIGMVLHEFPEGIVTYLLLDRSGFSKRRASLFAFLAAALSTPIGTLISFPLIRTIDPSALGALLAASAGALVYVGASHLLPAVEQENKRHTLIALLVGIGVAFWIVFSQK